MARDQTPQFMMDRGGTVIEQLNSQAIAKMNERSRYGEQQ
jgi:hypothetical protein